MIGPTSAFYDPEQALAQAQESAEYQRWVEAYGSSGHQMEYTPGAGDHNVTGLPQFRQQRLQPQEAISGRIPHTTTTEPVPLQNQYQFVSAGQYGPPPVIDHHYISGSGRQAGPSERPAGSDYSASVRTHQQHSPGSLHGAVGYNQPTMNSDLYYYPSDLIGASASDQSQSYGYTSGGGSHQQHQYQSPVAASTGFTPSSDLHTLPPHTSVSPPWTEERLPQGYGPGPPTAGPSTLTGPSTAQKPPRLGQPTGKRERGSVKKPVVGRKRPRKSGAGESESESDEDASEAVQTPSRGGPENLPTRL